MENKNYVHSQCSMDKRLEIMYDEYKNEIMLSRCCYTHPFAHLSIKDFLKINDIIEYSCIEREHILKEAAKGWCASSCEIKPEIKVVTVGLSRACNLHCYNCFFTKHVDHPELKELYFTTLEKIKGHQLDNIHMQSSGEVFFYYFKIKEYLKTLTLEDTKEVNFQTNGLLLDRGRLNELKEISDKTGVLYTFNYSFDAITEETYKKVRIGGDFNKLIKVFEDTLDIFGPENTQTSFTIKKPNIHETALFREYFRDKYNFYRTYVSYDLFDKDCHAFFNTLDQKDIC